MLMRDPVKKVVYTLRCDDASSTVKSPKAMLTDEGKGVGQFTQKLALEKWLEIKQWSLDNDKNPGEFAKSKQQEVEFQETLGDTLTVFS